MDAMELFRARVEQSAKAAAGAARQLSSLDDMAQNDDYIQSEGLRVSDKKELPSSAAAFSENSSVVEDLSGRFVDALSTAARKHNRPRPVNETNPRNSPPYPGRQSAPVELVRNQKLARENPANAVKQQKSVPKQPRLVSSVAALYDQNEEKKRVRNQPVTKQKKTHHSRLAKERGDKSHVSKNNHAPTSLATIPSSPGQHTNVLLVNDRHAHILHQLDYDSDAESSDDEQPVEPLQNSSGSDLEMGRVGNVALHDQLEQELEESISRQNSLNGPTNGNERKDAQRFMNIGAGFESERESLLQVPESTPTNTDRVGNAGNLWAKDVGRGTAGEETSKALKAGLSWVRNVASPQLEAFSKQIITKVSEADVRQFQSEQHPGRGPMIGPRYSPPTRNDAEEEKITMTSSATFLADEDMAELERIRMKNSPSKLRAVLANPRLAFIAVTLVIALFAYFYSRHRSVDDVL
ncbi:hypothetical protein ACHAXR_012456 [Thalassiosira sp. AJA248-18]